MSEWQPIETAPKDGTRVLLFCEKASWTDRREMVTGYWDNQYGDGKYWSLVQTGGYAEDDDVYPHPTHWQPLPEPPSLPLHGEDE